MFICTRGRLRCSLFKNTHCWKHETQFVINNYVKIVYNDREGPSIFAHYIRFSLYTIIGYKKLLATTG